MTTLGELRARQQQVLFVGRTAEHGLLETGLCGGVFYVHGPGGAGKTALVRNFLDKHRLTARWLDARDLEMTPDGVLRAIGELDAQALVLDSYELARPIDRWVRESLLARLPEKMLVVIATRDVPSEAWRSDPLWGSVIRPVALGGLSEADARAYLERRGIAPAAHASAIAFTRGQPLALTLVADVCLQRAATSFAIEEHPDVVAALVQRLAREAPDPRHRRALEACAVVRSCNQPLLAAMLDDPDPQPVFEWLCGLSFVQQGASGVFPHDLARDALVRELKWRDPDTLGRLIARAHAYYEVCIADRGAASWRFVADDVYLHRFSPVLAAVLEWNESAGLSVESATEHDVAAIVAMTEKHEGRASAELVAHWLAQQLGAAVVLRDGGGAALGFVLAISMLRASEADIAHDPATRAIASFMQGCGPIRRGDDVLVFRAWMARDSHQAPSPAQAVALMSTLHRQLTTPSLALTFLVCHDADAFAEVMRYSLARRMPDCDFEVGGHRFGMYHYDFRHMSPSAFLGLMAKRASGIEIAEQPIDHGAFVEAVHDALVEFGEARPVADSVLARSRLVRAELSRTGDGARVVIERLLRDAAEALRKTPRGARQARVIEQTYFGGRITQEQAAELLDLPFSTYRRYLAAGTSAISELLWIRELGAT